jgi:hypothetical protein
VRSVFLDILALADLDLFLSVSSMARLPPVIPKRLIMTMVLTASSISHGILDRLNIHEMAAVERLPSQALLNLAQHTVRVANIAMMQKESQDFWILVSFRVASCFMTARSTSC